MLGLGMTGLAVIGRGGASAFDPAALGDLVARYDAGAGLFADMAGTLPATGGDAVGRWSDLSGNGHHLVQSGASRPTAHLLGGRNSVRFGGAHWLGIPAGLSLDKRASTIVAVMRTRSPEIQALWHMPAAGTEHALYLGNGIGAGELRFYADGPRASQIASSHGTSVIAAVNGPGGIELRLGGERAAGLTASPAGSVAGGRVGSWDGGNFPLVGDVHELLLFGRALTGVEVDQLIGHLASKHRALAGSEDCFLAFEGDSITQGVGATIEADFCFPAQLARLCTTEPKWINLGSGGDTIQNMAATANMLTGQLLANSHYGSRVAVLLAGTNDINVGRSAAQVIGDIDAWIAAVRAADPGAVPVGCTILPRTDFGGEREAARQAVNMHVLGAADFAFAVDLSGLASLANPADAAVYVDGIHPTDAGYAVIAAAVHGALTARSIL